MLSFVLIGLVLIEQSPNMPMKYGTLSSILFLIHLLIRVIESKAKTVLNN